MLVTQGHYVNTTQDTVHSVVNTSLLTRSFPYPRHTIKSALKNT